MHGIGVLFAPEAYFTKTADSRISLNELDVSVSATLLVWG
jgi:hypothetical protein